VIIKSKKAMRFREEVEKPLKSLMYSQDKSKLEFGGLIHGS
jgi:hypothetical protein